MKKCTKCLEVKPIKDFWKNKTRPDGRQVWCNNCWRVITKARRNGPKREIELRQRRNRHLIRKYGITADDYDAKIAKQNGLCGICLLDKDSQKYLAVDHDHETGKVRGILCENCNRGIGMFKHDPELLILAKAYLENHWW